MIKLAKREPAKREPKPAIQVDLKPGDYRGARRKNVTGCVLARALKRKTGRKWRVDHAHSCSKAGDVVMEGGTGRKLKMGADAIATRDRFDAGARQKSVLRDGAVSFYPANRKIPPARPAAPARAPQPVPSRAPLTASDLPRRRRSR